MNPLHLGLIGHPLSHSVSPAIHQAALEAVGLEGQYRLYPIPPLPEGNTALEKLLNAVRDSAIAGLNVTIPHKQNVLPHLDRLSTAARAIGAVNTISLRDGALTGDNTDAEGFHRDLARSLAPEHGSALVLGAGGAARAVVYALGRSGWSVTVAARQPGQAEQLARDLPGVDRIAGLPPDKDLLDASGPTLIVNTTPLGMGPHVEASPWPDRVPFPPGCTVYDLVYNPPETAFLRSARRAGVRTAGGLGMLVEQAALAFEIWTGHRPPVDALRETAEIAVMTMRKDIG